MQESKSNKYFSVKYMAGLAVAIVLAIFIGSQIGNGDTTAEKTAAPDTSVSQENNTTTDVESGSVEEMLTFLVEEEKLAHDLYVQLAQSSGSMQFNNILNSEVTHISLVQGLLASYDIVDPTIGLAEGEFLNPDLQALYDSLLVSGSVDRAGAIAAGIAVEEKDIADIEAMLATELPSDVVSVLERLLSGSQNHLAAFQRG